MSIHIITLDTPHLDGSPYICCFVDVDALEVDSVQASAERLNVNVTGKPI